MNFVPTRPAQDIVSEYLDVYDQLYDPVAYIERAYRAVHKLGRDVPGYVPAMPARIAGSSLLNHVFIQASGPLTVVWRQEVVRTSRFVFWFRVALMAVKRPRNLPFFIVLLLQNEHFLAMRETLTRELAATSKDLPSDVFVPKPEAAKPKKKTTQPKIDHFSMAD